MSDLTSLIKSVKEAKISQELIATSVRIPLDLSLFIDDLAEQLDFTKQEMLLELLKEGISVAKKALNLDEIVSENETSKFYLLNTNRRWDEDFHKKMLAEGLAAAFYNPWKKNINRIKENDLVFLYSNGEGITGFGRGTGNTIVEDYQGHKDECFYQKLLDFQKLEKPLSAKDLRRILNCNFPLLRTMSPMKDGQKILDFIQNKK